MQKNPVWSFAFILLSLPGNLKSFPSRIQKILSLFTELFTSPANAPVNKFLAFSRKCIFHGGISRITAGKIRTTDITQLSDPRRRSTRYNHCLLRLRSLPPLRNDRFPLQGSGNYPGKFIGKSLDQPELGHIKISLICCICFPFPGINIYLGFPSAAQIPGNSGKENTGTLPADSASHRRIPYHPVWLSHVL